MNLDKLEYVRRLEFIKSHRREMKEKAKSAIRFHTRFNTHGSANELLSIVEKYATPAAAYHSPYHMHCMVVQCNDALEFYAEKNSTIPFDHVGMEALILSALFHDIGHSGGTDPDNLNVARSMSLYAQHVAPKVGYLTDVNKQVYDNIEVTQFPFIHEPKNLYQQILRDADLLMSLQPDWFETLYVDLRSEICNARKMTFGEFCVGQVKFMQGVRFYTKWFEEAKKPEFDARMKEMEDLARRFGNETT